ncbi:hypothetical protein RND81_09G163000 [Saponaria officinalis]|uniref:Uncharacterized protein n=1 Tax=Saponaria officinalis TaxID=3572 RepID=A0AAW1IN84_SAPOF
MGIYPCSLLDELYCEEETWEIEEKNNLNEEQKKGLLKQDLFWEDEELKTLFKKEKIEINYNENLLISKERKEAVKWMIKVNINYGFSALTTILSVNYFDKCISCLPFIQINNKPWTFQLVAVACVSLAAKIEETFVPLILDLQVEGAKVVFEPKDVQKMELLVLSTLDWKMHQVTPLSFLDHIIRRLGLNHQLHWDFLNQCETVLLSLLPDWRFVRYIPSVLAAATMMHVIDQIQPSHSLHYHFQLLNVITISQEKVKDCYEMIVEASKLSNKMVISRSKRKIEQMMMNNNSHTNATTPNSSPSGVMEAYWFSSDSSNDSWVTTSNATTTGGRASTSSSVSSSPVMSRKKGRVNEQPMTLQLPSLSRVFVDVVESPH